MTAYKTVSYVGFVIMIFGIILCFYGFSFFETQNDLEANGIKTTGEVFDINENGIYRSPWVKFTTEDKQEHKFLSQLEVNMDIFPYSIGQQVDIIYHKDNPSQAKIDTFWESNFEQSFLGFFGIGLIIFGLLMRIFFLGKAKKYAQR